MALDLNKMEEEWTRILNSKETDDYFAKLEEERKIEERVAKDYWAKFLSLTETEQAKLVEKVVAYYCSDKYYEKNYRVGREPNDELYQWFSGLIREKYGRDAPESFWGCFSVDVWLFTIANKTWLVNEIQGQGYAMVVIPENEIEAYLNR